MGFLGKRFSKRDCAGVLSIITSLWLVGCMQDSESIQIPHNTTNPPIQAQPPET